VKLCSIITLAALPLLGGCMQHFQSSVAGTCKVFERPPYAVRGATSYDQNVADKFVESGVAGCNWRRPAARPASLDVPAKRKAVATPVKRKSFVKRIRDRILPPKVGTPAPAEIPVPTGAPDPVPPPPLAPRRPIDELLRPSR
jgi:hypothetical protein